jgi:choline dehydrogenase
MARDEMSVVDGQLRVYGVDGLRLADGSILPCVTTGNTMAPRVVIGEQAAAFLTRATQMRLDREAEIFLSAECWVAPYT